MSIDSPEQELGFAGGGELGDLIRNHDWASTSLGPISEWPDSLRTAVRIMLASRQPIWIGWGDELIYLYNDAYKSIIGGKHPQMLGRPTRVVWSELWDVIEPMLQTAMTSEQGTYVESQLLIMERYGYREETYYTFSYSPIPGDDGRARGIICVNTDDTQRVIGERQLGLLRELAAKTAETLTVDDVCARAGEALATDPRDLPFAMLYLADESEGGYHLAGSAGIEGLDAPPFIPFGSERAVNRLDRAYRDGETFRVANLAPLAPGSLPTGAWDEPPPEAAYMPLVSAGSARTEGLLIAALSPYRAFDEAYSDFLGLIAGQISASLATARAYENERTRAEVLAELDRAKTQFFSNVSHEFRTPLTLMLGSLEEAGARGGDTVEMQSESFGALRRNALRLLRMVNTVLDFSRVSAGYTVSVFRRTELERLTREVAEHFRPVLERNAIDFAVDIEPLGEPVYVDHEAWEKIVLNLLSNAFKFTLRGEVRVALDRHGEMARLTVADTGTGISADELPHLFERFHRVRNDEARTHEGTGIGLALVRELVELHSGTVAAKSQPDEGTTFTILLPFGREHLPPKQVRDEPEDIRPGDIAAAFTEEAGRWSGVETDAVLSPAPAAGEDDTMAGAQRIAVVDDNADMRDYMVRLLEPHWQVDAYPDGQAALEAIRESPPSLVVTDVMMPRLDGFGLLAALREDPATATIPIVVVSARAGEDSSVEGLEAGADDYLVKPFSARELVARVRSNLELSRLRAEAGRLAAVEEVRSRVVTTVSHELRTPVTAIYGASRTLERAGEIDEAARQQLLGVIAKESERLARITNDILTTETLAPGMTFDVARFDLRSIVADAVRAAEAGAPGGIQLVATLPSEPAEIVGDRARLQQVLANLLDNAIKYSPDGGTVEARVEPGEERVTVEICDEGIGIPPEMREDIFRRFYRVDPTLSTGVGGTGLGLFISRQIVEAMGGTITADGNEPRGTRMCISLPRG